MTAATSLMFTFYSNLLSPESKYAWNKIVGKQTKSNPYVNLQGVSLEGPRGMSCKLFNSLTPKSVPAGTKLLLFGRYVLNIYVGIV
jgi:hypothetical protein